MDAHEHRIIDNGLSFQLTISSSQHVGITECGNSQNVSLQQWHKIHIKCR
jgi:hypothetical protein